MATLCSAKLYEADFHKANLDYANFSNDELNMGLIFPTDLHDSDFTQTHLYTLCWRKFIQS